MSNQFIGLTMLVTLSDPPGAQVRGIVSSIVPGKSLTLRNVTAPASGRYLPEYTIPASEIAELVEATNENVKRPPTNTVPPQQIPTPSFEDPAILSVGRKPSPNIRQVSANWSATSMERGDSARTAKGGIDGVLRDLTATAAAMERRQSTRSAKGTSDGTLKELTATASLEEPLRHVSLAEIEATPLPLEELEAGLGETPLEQPMLKKRQRRRKGKKAQDGVLQEVDAGPTKETTRSKGWRNTPLLEPNPSFQPFSSLKRQKGRGKQRIDENGWATEDASEVQEMGDFDFLRSLAKFDKHSVFEKIQAEDSIAEEDRLVSHNRLPKAKPGTAGGKNYHYTENVLDSPNGHGLTPKGTPKTKAEAWKSEESELEERGSLRGNGSGRQSRRAESKLATNRRPSSKKGTAIIGGQPTRSLSIATQISSKPSFHLMPSDRRCETISALQMLNLENIADNELGLTEDMMAENAGRGIAEVAFTALNTPIRRNSLHSQNSSIPTVVVFAGNNKSGLRGVAAGRHIRNHGVNAVICVLGIERESELLVGLKRQIKVFRSFGGKVISKTELLEYIKTLEAPVDLIIDGLLGLTISFEELRTGDQATAYELIEWANRSKAAVLAIDIPTGIDPASGKVNIIDGRQLCIHARYVVAMGAPKRGLLEAMCMGEGVSEEGGQGWKLWVVDVGLGKAVWKKAGTRVRRGVEFEGAWVVGLRFWRGVE